MDHVDRSVGSSSRRSTSRSSTQESPAIGYSVVKVQDQYPVFTIVRVQFYAPIYMLLTMCDREPHREAELTVLLEQHIRQFSRIYSKEDNV